MRIRRVIIGITVFSTSIFLCLYFIAALSVVLHFNGTAQYPVDCAVVFGSAVHRGSKAGPGIQRRTETATELWKENQITTLIFTGGTGEGNELSEARVMYNVALHLGVDPSAIQLEEGATSTWQNIAFTKPLLQDCTSIVGISDNYHLARIRLSAWGQGIPMKVAPAKQKPDRFFIAWSTLREALGILLYTAYSFST